MRNNLELNYLDNEQIVFDNMKEAVIIFENDGSIMYYNDAAANFYGIKDSDEIETLSDIAVTGDKNNKAFTKFVDSLFEKGDKEKSEEIEFDNGIEKRILKISSNRIVKDGRNKGFMLLAADMTPERELRRFEKDSSIIFSGIVICISLYLFAWSFIEFTLEIHLKMSTYTAIIEGIAILLFFEVLFFTSLTLKDVGVFVSPKKIFRSVLSVIIPGAIVCALMIIINVVLRNTGHAVKANFIGGSLKGALNYIIVAVLQEFLSRGVIQTSVRFLVKVKWQKFFNVFLSSLLFSLMHLPFGFIFMMGAFVMGLVLGTIYEYQKNIWGCALLHWGCGYLAMAMFF